MYNVDLERGMNMNENKGLMTQGVIWKQILVFSIPLLLGNLFQQLYNTVDSIVVGNTIGSDALAAVGSSGPIVNLLVSFFMGLSMGSSVIISQYFGAKNHEKLSKAVHTAMLLSILIGIVMTFVGIYLTPYILEWMGTPASVMGNSVLYLKIYFTGMIGMMVYNMGSAILRAIGDSKNPLYFLMLSSCINIVLDIVFVVYMNMGIAGAAWATMISQCVSAFLILIMLMRSQGAHRLELRKLKVDGECLQRIVRIGLPSGLQNAVVSFSNVIVQVNINSFGSLAMAGCSSYTKIDGFAILPVMSFSMAMTTFIGQNIGAECYDRAKEGSKVGILMSLIVTVCVSGVLLLFAPQLISIFNADPEVVYYGTYMMRSVVPGYIFLSIAHALSGILRGAGKTMVPMVVMIASWCLLRMAWIFVLMPIFNDIYVVFSGYVVTWFVSAVALLYYYRKGDWLKRDY